MKTALSLLAFAALPSTASAVEYMTRNVHSDAGPEPGEFGPSSRTVTVSPTSRVEVVAWDLVGQGWLPVLMTMADGTKFWSNGNIVLNTTSGVGKKWGLPKGGFFGVAQVKVGWDPNDIRGARGWLTLKITSATEITAVTPSSVLVLPEEQTGNFDVIIEKSDDLVNWEPFFSQTVNSQTADRFFRTRVTKTP